MHTGKQTRRSNRLISNIDAIGFASVLLVLLLTLTAPYTTGHHRQGRDVNMAKVDRPVEMLDADRDDAMLIVIAKDGRVYWGNDEIEPAYLPLRIEDRVNRGSPKVIYLEVDSRTKYGDVKNVLDAVRTSGLEKIAFLVEKSSNGKL